MPRNPKTSTRFSKSRKDKMAIQLSEVVKSRTSLRVLQVGVVERRLAADASVRGKVVPDSLAKTTQDLQPKCGLNTAKQG
eukprot:COSAG04_NODE_341_length_16294_cov_8.682618_7_plen_80_part_00